MKPQQSTVNNIIKLWAYLSLRRKQQFFLLLIMMIFVSCAEIISIGAVFPFLALLIQPEGSTNQFSLSILSSLNISNSQNFLILIMLGFGLSVLFASGLRILLLVASTKFSFKTGSDLSSEIYMSALSDPYETQITRNSSDLISSINAKAGNVVHSIIMPSLTLISAFIMMVMVLVILVALNSASVVLICGFLAILYIAIGYLAKMRLVRYSNLVSYESNQTIKLLQEGFGAIRDILIDGNQRLYREFYTQADQRLRKAQGNIIIFSQFPRYLIEAVGIFIIIGFTYYLSFRGGDNNLSIPILGAMALGAQRLLPYFQQSYAAWTSIKGNHGTLVDILALLKKRNSQLIAKNAIRKINFTDSIELKNISFRYRNEQEFVFKDLNLKIYKGEKIGLMGPSGCGKSTLLDLFTGILSPTSGDLFVDGVRIADENISSWHKCVAHVPQAIFLSDASVAENIAFGVPFNEIDYKRVDDVIRQVSLDGLIKEMPLGIQAHVGERGSKLSGGQRQRLGIARALYKNAELIIFDEATSALDADAENEIMGSVTLLDSEITIIVVSHQMSTLKNCSKILDIAALNFSKESIQ